MNNLKFYLLLNSIFSGITGLGMLLFSSFLNELFKIQNEIVFPFIGINLIVFSAFVAYTAIKQLDNKLLIRLISGLDVLWVLGSLLIILRDLFSLSEDGKKIISVVAIWIAFLAIKQYRLNR